MFTYGGVILVTASSFGEFLHMVRIRQKGAQLAKNAGISYVYLLDIEKGARPVPTKKTLIALANNLVFENGERETFFDYAAKEKNEVPADITEYISENDELINIIRHIKSKNLTDKCWASLFQYIQNTFDEEKTV